MKKILTTLDRNRNHTATSNGNEDIDEIFLQVGKDGHCHIEKMSQNEYCIILGAGHGKNYKSTIIFIGHWPPKRPSRGGNLTMNIAENELKGKWHY